MARVFLCVDRGSFGHTSISLTVMDNDLSSGHGTRIAGLKQWGGGRPIHEFELDTDELDCIIEECLAAKAVLGVSDE